MKLRSEFVSNSSTSSFVLLGAKIIDLDAVAAVLAIDHTFKEELADAEYPEDVANEILWDQALGKGWKLHDEESYFGIEIAYGCSDSYDVQELSLSDLKNHIQEVERVFKALGITKEVKLLSGTMMS